MSDAATRNWSSTRSRTVDGSPLDRAAFNADGLLPAIIQQWDTGEVLMLGWMDREALRRTLTEGRVTFWSRSRQEYWRKGDTSGHVQYVRGAALDCDADTLLVHGRAGRRRLPHRHAHLLRRRPAPGRRGIRARRLTTPNDDEEHPTCRPPPRASRSSPRCCPTTASCPSCASSSPTARRPSASTASSRRAARARFLLESAEQGGIWSRYSFVGVSSFGVLTEATVGVEWQDYGLSAERALGDAADLAPLAALEPLFERWRTADVAGRAAAHRRPRRLHRLGGDPPDRAPAEPAAGRLRRCRDRRSPSSPSSSSSTTARAPCSSSRRAERRRRRARGALGRRAGAPRPACSDASPRPSEAWLAEIDLATRRRPRRIAPRRPTSSPPSTRSKEYIREGDIFQVVISQRFEQEATAHPIDVYRVLRSLNPSPYMYLLHLDDPAGEPYWIVGSSPEALVKVQDGRVFTHPIAGSKPRGATPEAGRRPRGRAARRPQGAGRAPHARRPRPQRPREGLHGGHASR